MGLRDHYHYDSLRIQLEGAKSNQHFNLKRRLYTKYLCVGEDDGLVPYRRARNGFQLIRLLEEVFFFFLTYAATQLT